MFAIAIYNKVIGKGERMPTSMRCFKSFFQHTWHPQQMVIVPSPGSIWDYPYLNQVTSMMGLVYGTGPELEQDFFPSKNRIPESHMESPSRFELTKTKTQSMDEMEFGEVKTSNVATSTPVPSGSIPCRNGGCKGWTSTAESPWHFLKTVFLISVIVALVLWVIVYAFLTQYKIL